MNNEDTPKTPPFFFNHGEPYAGVECGPMWRSDTSAKVEEWAAKFAKLQTENTNWRFAAHSVALWSPLPPPGDLTPREFMSRMADATLRLIDRAREAEAGEADAVDLLRRLRREICKGTKLGDESREAVMAWAISFLEPRTCGICGKPTDEMAIPRDTLPNEPDPKTTFAHEECLWAKRREAFLGLSPEVKSRLVK